MRVGRPRRGDEVADCPVRIRLTKSERSALERVARDNALPIVEVLREAVNCYVADYGERMVFIHRGFRRPKP